MDDHKIKDLFAGYQPELSSDFDFMASLNQKLEAVDIVKRQMRQTRRRNRIAVAIAAVAGFAMGAITTLLAPLIAAWAAATDFAMPIFDTGYTLDLRTAAYIAAAIAAILTAYNAYEISLARLSRPRN